MALEINSRFLLFSEAGNASKMPKDGRCALVKIIVDIVILAVAGFSILIFHLIGVPYHRGFYCDDDSIRYPFKPSTVNNNVLYIIGVFLPILTICGNECYANFLNRQCKLAHKHFTLIGKSIPPLVWELYKHIGVFLFGACVSQLTTDIAKYSIGRLRPHFLYVCKPDLRLHCQNLALQHEYVDKYECTGDDANLIREARLSFPSGHSSFSAFTMFYLVFYLQGRMCVTGNKLLKPFIQFGLIMMTWSCALSRISDYKHHWSDVLIGFLLGVIVAALIAYFVSDIFTKPERQREGNSINSSVAHDPAATTYNTINLEQQ